MPILERAAPVASDENTLAAIEAIRAAVSSAPIEDSPAGEHQAASPAPGPGPFGHGKIRLHTRA